MSLAARGDGSRVCASVQEGGTKNSKLSLGENRERTDELQAREKLKIVKCDTLSHPLPLSHPSIVAYPEERIRRGKNSWSGRSAMERTVRLSLHARV